MAFSNSALVNYTKISPNKTTTNRMPIDRITIHHAAGNILIESMGTMFANPSQRSSSNYGIGTDGRIAMYVEECHSSWCSSSTENDKRAVTIEVANSSNTDKNWPVSDKALDSTIKLCADICKRNGKSKAVYFPTLAEANAYKLGTQEMLFTLHEFYRQKCCPGPYLKSKMSFIISEVNKILSGGTASSTVPSTPNTITTPVTNPSLKTPYIVRVKANGLNIRSGPGTSNSITGCIKDNGVYTIINEVMVNNKTPWGELKLGGWICVDNEYVDKLRSIEEDSKAESSPIGDPVDSKPGIGIDEIIWLYFQKKGFNDFAIAGILGNLFAESGLSSINLQNAFESKLGMTDEEYTAAVDNGSYTNFDSDGAGYGIPQWTYSTRKQGLKTLATLKKTSVGDLNLQLEFLFNEITSDPFRSCYDKLMAATSLEDATYTFLLDFEKPANAEQFKVTRLNYAKNYYNKFNTGNAGVGTENKVPYTVRITANELNIRDNPSLKGNKVGVITDHGIYTIIEEKLNVDGYNWGRLKSGAGWIVLNWIEKV